MTDREILAALAAPFPSERVSWRLGTMKKDGTGGMALAYIDARDVQDRLDNVVGLDWENEFIAMPNGTLCCRIGIYIDGRMRWRSDGAGATDVEAEKGTYSDAFKRAGVKWGIARYLYEMPSPWVDVTGDKFKRIADHELPKLRALLDRGGAAPKSSAQAKKEDSWKTMIGKLKVAVEQGTVAAFASDPETRRIISEWPDKWQEAWVEKVAQAVELARAA